MMPNGFITMAAMQKQWDAMTPQQKQDLQMMAYQQQMMMRSPMVSPGPFGGGLPQGMMPMTNDVMMMKSSSTDDGTDNCIGSMGNNLLKRPSPQNNADTSKSAKRATVETDYKALMADAKALGISGKIRASEPLKRLVKQCKHIHKTFQDEYERLNKFEESNGHNEADSDDEDDDRYDDSELKPYGHDIDFSKNTLFMANNELDMSKVIQLAAIVAAKLRYQKQHLNYRIDLSTATTESEFVDLIKDIITKNNVWSDYEGSDNIDFDVLITYLPMEEDKVISSRIKLNGNVYCRITQVMTNNKNILMQISQGYEDRKTQRLELDADGKEMLDTQWKILLDQFNDHSIQFDPPTFDESSPTGVEEDDISSCDANARNIPKLLLFKFRKAWNHIRYYY